MMYTTVFPWSLWLPRDKCRWENIENFFSVFCFLLLVSICNVFANGETSHRLELIKCSFLLSFASSRAPSGLPSIAVENLRSHEWVKNTKQSRVSLESAVITLKKCHFMWKTFFSLLWNVWFDQRTIAILHTTTRRWWLEFCVYIWAAPETQQQRASINSLF